MSALNNMNIKNSLESNLERKMQTGFIENEGQLLGKQPLAHQNPLDRNHDGRVDLKDLTGRPGMNQGLNQGIHHNPLDRNFDGRVDMNDLSGRTSSGVMTGGMMTNQTTYIQSGQRASLGLTRAEPTVREVIQKDTVIHEHIHPVQKEEIQPIIYREREQLDVKQITQMMHETQIRPTILEQRELPAERREAIIERGAPIAPNMVLPSSQIDATTRTQIVHAPIINEVIKKTVVQEIQPVLERDVFQSTVIQNTLPIYEKIIEAPQVTREVVSTRVELGTVDHSGRRLSQGFSNTELQGQRLSGNYNELAGNRRLSQTYVEQPIYNGQMGGEAVLTKRGLESAGTQNMPLNHGQGMSSSIYNQPIVENRRLSQNYNEPLVQNRRLSQNYGLQQQGLQQQVLPQQAQWGVNSGPAPFAGMNNTGLGMATAIPNAIAAPMMNVGMAPNMQSQNLSQGPVRYASSNSNYGLQGNPAYQTSMQQEKMREMQREQMLRQDMPQGFGRV